jgi:hypothetical protein
VAQAFQPVWAQAEACGYPILQKAIKGFIKNKAGNISNRLWDLNNHSLNQGRAPVIFLAKTNIL